MIFQGFVEWQESTIPGGQPNHKHLYQSYAKSLGHKFFSSQIVEYFDCFFRNIYKYEYIGVFDIDELIVPTNADNWTQMIDNINV
jgi:hypothetical protein